VYHEAGGYVLYDLGSRNGTFVNGERTQSRMLLPGDQIAIGEEAFRFEAPAEHKPLPLTPQIVALRGSLVGRRFALGAAPLSFGRSAESTVVIADRQASRRHAEVYHEAGGYVLHDLGSRNGTFVNGERTQSRMLRPGDQIAIGDEAFGFETGDTPAADSDDTLIAQRPELSPSARICARCEPAPSVRSRNQPDLSTLTYGIRCPKCGRVIEPHQQHCPWHGALLANGRTVPIDLAAHFGKKGE
jgi:pSer/pThr/pTyr-binding forkhead associated (FHA) protein